MINVERQINYIEFPATDLKATEAFYNQVFGWEFQNWGDVYYSFSGAGIEGGFDSNSPNGPQKPGVLVILYSADLGSVMADIRAADGEITQEPYDFPGGRRFHFKDPNGNELAVWSENPKKE